MPKLMRSLVVYAFALMFAATNAFAQDRQAFSRAELDQMLAPVALYPDALLSQILMASTYPLEVVQAARWSRANPGYSGQDAVNAVEHMDWDPSVKSLVAFPQVLARMNEQLDWTQRLGEAFLAQQADVMDAVQALRQRAAVAGNLGADERLNIVERDGAYIIEPAQPQVVYVPYYDPTVVYGPWWWPAYPPVYWGPPAGYYVGPAYYPGLYWSSGIRVSIGFFFGAFDWHRRHVHIAHVHRYHALARRQVIVGSGPHLWRHDHRHRRGVPYHYAGRQRDYSEVRNWNSGARRDFRERTDATSGQRLDGSRTGPTGERRDWRNNRDERRTDRDGAAVQSAVTQTPSTSTAEIDARRTRSRAERVAPPASESSAPRSERVPNRVQNAQREQRPETERRNFRSSEPRQSRQPSEFRSAVRPEPQARARPERVPGLERAARAAQPSPRAAVSAPAQRFERSAPRGNEGARFQNRDRGRQESSRGRDRRS